LEVVTLKEQRHFPKPIVAVADVTFFKRDFGVCVFRAPHLKKNLYEQEVQSETVDVYRQGRSDLEKRGYMIHSNRSGWQAWRETALF